MGDDFLFNCSWLWLWVLDHSRCGEEHPWFVALWQQDSLVKTWKKKSLAVELDPWNQLISLKVMALPSMLQLSVWKGPQTFTDPQSVLPWIAGIFPVYNDDFYLLWQRGTNEDLPRLEWKQFHTCPFNCTFVVGCLLLSSPLWGCRAVCVYVCVCVRISQPSGWPLILLLRVVASVPSFLSNIYWKHVLRNLWACNANECVAWSGAADAKGRARFLMRKSRDPSVESRGPSMRFAARGCRWRFFFLWCF